MQTYSSSEEGETQKAACGGVLQQLLHSFMTLVQVKLVQISRSS